MNKDEIQEAVEKFVERKFKGIVKEPLKPGQNSTEFWVTTIFTLGTIAISIFKPEWLKDWTIIVGGGLAVLGYNVSRGMAKSNGKSR